MYPFVSIGDLFDQLKGEVVFSNIDLISRYHQVHIKEVDIYKTPFWTRFGHCEFVVVPYS